MIRGEGRDFREESSENSRASRYEKPCRFGSDAMVSIRASPYVLGLSLASSSLPALHKVQTLKAAYAISWA